MRNIIEKDRRVNIGELSDQTGEGKTTIDVILKERLKKNKVCARSIPWILTEENKKIRVSASMEFLRRQRLEGGSVPRQDCNDRRDDDQHVRS